MDYNGLNWKIQAGDQIPESEDDQKCGDHYIKKGLECHDGDAHRPTPGKNPYWQNGRKGPQHKPGRDEGGRPSDTRDRNERTKRSDEEGSHGGPEEQAKFATKRFDHYADMMEENDPGMEWTDDKKFELLEMVMRDTAREFSLDSDQLGFTDKNAVHYGPIDNYLSSRDKGRKGRSMWRPRKDERHGPGTNVQIPPEHRDKEGLVHDVDKKTREPQKKEAESSLSLILGLAKKLNWVTATKPGGLKTEHSGSKKGKGAWMKKKDAKKQSNKKRRAADKQATVGEEEEEEEENSAFPGAAPVFTKASKLNWGRSILAEPRPCYPSEDPVEDHCNPNISPDGDGNDSYVDDYGGGEDPGGFDWENEGFQVIDPDNDTLFDDEEEEWDPEKWKEEIEKDEVVPQPPEDSPEQVKDPSRQEPPVQRDPRLGEQDPHQFWTQNEDYAQNLLPKLQERAKQGDQDAARLLREGPKAGRYEKKTLFDTMQDPKFWDKKGSQKYKEQVEKEEGLEPGSLGPMSDDEARKIRDYYYSDEERGPIV